MTSTTLDCPQCGEQNPREAVMCWACYTPFSDDAAVHKSKKKRPEINIQGGAKESFRFALFASALSLLLASGYLPERRLALLGMGVTCVAALVCWFNWDKRTPSSQVQADEETPTARILDTILLYGVRDGAAQIRLRAGIGIRVHCLINGQWHEQMRIPHYIWVSLRSLLLEKTDNWQRPIPFATASPDGLPFDCWPEYKVDPDYPIETVLLTLRQTLPPRPKTMESELA